MIKIGNSRDPLARIAETVENLRYLNTIRENGNAEFEFCEFAKPISIIPLAVVGHVKSLNFQNIPQYYAIVDFPSGQEISGYTRNGDTYFPITRADLICLNSRQKEVKLRELSDKYASLLQRNILSSSNKCNTK